MASRRDDLLLFSIIFSILAAAVARDSFESAFLSQIGAAPAAGKRWALLIAGSNGFENYRHQADVCHAYQVMKKGGLADENIVVFMYDDIAVDPQNPRPGTIINRPGGPDVYAGVPKDYVGVDVNLNNFVAALLGNKSAVVAGKGSSKKVIDSGPDDHIFVFYSDHGGEGVLEMPLGPFMYADDLNDALKKKHEQKGYKSLVFYLESCNAGSMFDGILSTDIGVYATTASDTDESSWGYFCPGDKTPPPPGYHTCLADLYSLSWTENSDASDLAAETLEWQYEIVRAKTTLSHVMEYGELSLNKEFVAKYFGGETSGDVGDIELYADVPRDGGVKQRDADLLHHLSKVKSSPEGSPERMKAMKDAVDVMSHRAHVDDSVGLVGKLLFGTERGPKVLAQRRPAGQPVVDDWECLKSTVRTFEKRCGFLSSYGMKHMGSLASICNAAVTEAEMEAAAAAACPVFPSNPRSSIERRGLSA